VGLRPTSYSSLQLHSLHRRLIVDSVSNIGPHYARTLREWRRRFLDRFEEAIVPALIREHPDVMSGERGREEIEVFKRKWICECSPGVSAQKDHDTNPNFD
jgi:hypothetical protein